MFGALRSGSPGATDFLFTGEQRDADSGLYYLRARYYDPGIGRFLGRDLLQLGNRYAYVASNPVNRVDPTGLVAWIVGGGGGAPKEGGNFGPTPTPSAPEPCWIVAGLTGCVHEPYEALCYSGDGRPYVCPKPPPGKGSCRLCGVVDAVLDALTSECAQ